MPRHLCEFEFPNCSECTDIGNTYYKVILDIRFQKPETRKTL